MPNLNKVMLMGNLTRDVELRYTPSGMGLATFGLAINRKFRDSKTNELREEVCFVDIEVWGKTAEVAGKYLSKGRPVFVEGRLKFDQWDDKQTGQKRSKLKVVGERIEFVDSRPGAPGASGQAPRPAASQPARPAQSAPPQQEPPDSGGVSEAPPPDDLDIPEENIPF